MTTSAKKYVGKFQLVDCGVACSQYFRGCGIVFTRFANVATGIGNDLAEAIDDCLEQMAQCGFDTEGLESRILGQEGLSAFPTWPRADKGSVAHYHVSLRWNEAGYPAVSCCDVCRRADCRNCACPDENPLPPHCHPL